MISHRHRFIFIHVPKTAGTSIEKKFGNFEKLDYGVQDHRPISALEPYRFRTLLRRAARRGLNGPGLRKEWQRYRTQALSPRQYRTYFKFSFVRNPWQRALSWYYNVIGDERLRREQGLKARGYAVPEDCTFKQFLTEFEPNGNLRPQLFWLKDSKGNLAMDFIGRFENLERDFAHVCGKLGIEDHSLPKMLVRERTEGADLFDSEVIDIIHQRYKEEIELFGYQFEGS